MTGYPFAVGAEEGLRGFAFNDGTKSFLSAIGGGKVEFVEGEERHREHSRDQQYRSDDTVEADACGFHCGEFACPAQRPKGDQNSHQGAKRRDVVEDERDEVQQVLADSDERRLVPDDVANELKKGEDDEKRRESCKDKDEVLHEAAHHVFVQNEREADVQHAPYALRDTCCQRNCETLLLLADEAQKKLAEGDTAARKHGEGDAATRHLLDQQEASGGEQQVRPPDTDKWRKLALGG